MNEGWTRQPLADVCKRITSGGTPSRKRADYYTYHDGHLWVKSKELGDRYIVDTEEHITDDGLANSSAKYIPEGSVLMAMYGATVGQLGYLLAPATVNQAVCALVPEPDVVDGRFLYHLLKHVRPGLTAMAHGAAQQNLNQGLIREYEISIPPLHVQRQIAKPLNAIDDLIANNNRRIEKLEEMARAIYRHWFIDFKYPGHEDVPLVESDLGLIPEEWEVTEIAETCVRLQAGGTPRRGNEEYWVGGTVDWYKTGELQDSLLFDSEERITETAVSDSSARIFEEGTILMAIYGSPTVGRLGVMTRRASCNQAALGFVPDGDVIQPEVLFYTLMEQRQHFNAIAQGAAQQNISKAKVAGTRILVPPPKRQAALVDHVRPMWGLIRNLAASGHALGEVRDLLLPKLVSGEIDVSELDIGDAA